MSKFDYSTEKPFIHIKKIIDGLSASSTTVLLREKKKIFYNKKTT